MALLLETSHLQNTFTAKQIKKSRLQADKFAGMFSFPPMAVTCPIHLLFPIVNVLMAASLVMSNSDFCASVFETQVGK